MSPGMLIKVGETQDGRPVFGGVYKITETAGVSLDVVLDCITGAGGVVAWPLYVDDAVAAGMKRERVLGRVEEATSDVLGHQAGAEIVRRLRL
jgi:hypothetical protein